MPNDDTTATAIQNLQAIKRGDDPRASPDESATSHSINTGAATGDDAILQAMEMELRHTLDEHSFLQDHISMDDIDLFVAGWKRRRGVHWGNRSPPKQSFEGRMKKKDFPRKTGVHAVGLARRVFTDELGWQGTVRHELAHAYLYKKHGASQKHNKKFKRCNQRIGGTSGGECPGDYEYALSCPNGCFMNGYFRRSKKLQKPWTRHCLTCETDCVSHDHGVDPTTLEPGTCAVESIDWDTQNDYWGHPTQSL